MKELVQQTNLSSSINHHYGSKNNNSTSTTSTSNNSTNITNGNNQRRYAVLSNEWVSVIGEELGMHPLPDSLLKKLAEDASYRLREILHKCVTRLSHSCRKKLLSTDVNAVITTLCDADPVYGSSDPMPSYHSEAQVFVPHEELVDVASVALEPLNLTQINEPHCDEDEFIDAKLTEFRHAYAKRALKILFNGSKKTFQVLLNDCMNNTHFDGEGILNILVSIARSTVISNNAQYTRVTTRACQLIIAITSNTATVYPYHINSVEKLTELLLELLLGQSFIDSNVETLFKTCALKLMLRWPANADKFLPMLENVLSQDHKPSNTINKKRITAMELLVGIQPLVFFQSTSSLSLDNLLKEAPEGSSLWHQVALSVNALVRSNQTLPNLKLLNENYGDSLLPYLEPIDNEESNENLPRILPIIVRSKIRYAKVRPSIKAPSDRLSIFPDSVLRGPRREIRFAFAGGRPVAPNNLRRVSLRANYQILRGDNRATTASVACRRLLILKDKQNKLKNTYNLAAIQL
ncbi:uncharacterized protein LOC123273216 [Cotesia glomerata]|uniref:Transcription initiation factor TFIID subunit 6 n=1 Tax=Cotesia glomerata TaxID=32391 RepID=A0AAV7J804_COTGL|nr:uncharacterized protein LOC123273216 [Cotesia glomerata]KAH0569071.1 hypothetical protein KQX54_021779 [Cotesia glomerata]